MLDKNNAAFVVIDVQGKLAQIVDDKETVHLNMQRMVKGAQALEIPVLWVQQYPQGLGPTIPELAELLEGKVEPVNKNAFSCCGEPVFMERLQALGRKQVVLIGIETHVCVYMTTADLIEAGYEVEVVADAVSSRTAANKHIGLEKIRELGGKVTCTETCLFELLRVSGGPAFKEILQIVK